MSRTIFALAPATCGQDEMNKFKAPSWSRPSSSDDHELEIDVRRMARAGGPEVAFVVSGDLDSMGAPELAQAWAAGVATLPARVHLDLGRVRFCNAAGIRTVDLILTSSRELGLEITLSMQAHLDWLLGLVGVNVGGLRQVFIVPRNNKAPT